VHPAAMERAGYWFRDAVPAPAPDPPPPAEPDPFSQLSEADRYAVMYPDRAVRIRAAGGLPADLDFGAPEPELVPDIVHGTSPILLALDRQRLNGAAKPARVAVSATASHATVPCDSGERMAPKDRKTSPPAVTVTSGDGDRATLGGRRTVSPWARNVAGRGRPCRTEQRCRHAASLPGL
jgi:hypothetical protein